MSTGSKYPLAEVLLTANKIVEALKPFCAKIEIVGSVRRGSQFIGDIEAVLIPKYVEVDVPPIDMFSQPKKAIVRTPQFAKTVTVLGKVEKGDLSSGRCVKFIENNSKMPVDLFITKEIDFGRICAIRTGSSFYSKDVLAVAWSRKGWCGTSEGLRRRSECTQRNGVWTCHHIPPTLPPPFPDEQSFFSFLGIKWVEPKDRNTFK